MLEVRDETGEVVELRIEQQDFIEWGQLSPAGIILPGHPLHDATLGQTLPPGWRNEGLRKFGDVAQFAFRPGSAVMEPLSDAELREYLNSGEWDERETEINSLET